MMRLHPDFNEMFGRGSDGRPAGPAEHFHLQSFFFVMLPKGFSNEGSLDSGHEKDEFCSRGGLCDFNRRLSLPR